MTKKKFSRTWIRQLNIGIFLTPGCFCNETFIDSDAFISTMKEIPMSENESSIPAVEQEQTPGINAQTIIGDSIKEGWGAFKAQAGLLIGMTFIVLVISAVGNGIIQVVFRDNHILLNLLQQLWSLLVVNVISAGFIITALKIIRKESVQLGELFSGFNRYGPLVLANFLYILGVVLGMVFLIVPGIILALSWAMYIPLIMDKHQNGTDALRKSSSLMKGYKGKFLLFFLLLIGINILGALALVVGILVSMPVTACAYMSFYNRLLQIGHFQVESGNEAGFVE